MQGALRGLEHRGTGDITEGCQAWSAPMEQWGWGAGVKKGRGVGTKTLQVWMAECEVLGGQRFNNRGSLS